MECAQSVVVQTPIAPAIVRARTVSARIRAVARPKDRVARTQSAALSSTGPFVHAPTGSKANRMSSAFGTLAPRTMTARRTNGVAPIKRAGTRVWSKELADRTLSAGLPTEWHIVRVRSATTGTPGSNANQVNNVKTKKFFFQFILSCRVVPIINRCYFPR